MNTLTDDPTPPPSPIIEPGQNRGVFVNARVSLYEARRNEEGRSGNLDPARVLMAGLLVHIKKTMKNTVLTKENQKEFDSQENKVLDKSSNIDTENNWLMRDRIRSTVIFPGPTKNLAKMAKEIEAIIKTYPGVIGSSISSKPQKENGYQDIKLYFAIKGGATHITNVYEPDGGRRVPRQKRVAEKYEMIVISANTAMAKDGPRKIKDMAAKAGKAQEKLFREQNSLVWGDHSLEDLKSVCHQIYKERLKLKATDRNWHKEFAAAYYAFFEDTKNKKGILKELLTAKINDLEDLSKEKVYPSNYSPKMIPLIEKILLVLR